MATMKLNGENSFNIFNVNFLVSASKLPKAYMYMCRYDLLLIRSFQYVAIALAFHKRNHLSSFIRRCSDALKSRLICQSSFLVENASLFWCTYVDQCIKRFLVEHPVAQVYSSAFQDRYALLSSKHNVQLANFHRFLQDT